MPGSFTFSPEGNYGGTCMNPVGGAKAFYLADSQQNGKQVASLIGRILGGGGRTISFSTQVGLVDLQSPDYKRLFVNAIDWAAAGTTNSPGTLTARPSALSFTYQTAGTAPATLSISISLNWA